MVCVRQVIKRGLAAALRGDYVFMAQQTPIHRLKTIYMVTTTRTLFSVFSFRLRKTGFQEILTLNTLATHTLVL